MSDDIIRPEQSGTFEAWVGSASAIGAQIIETVRGLVLMVDAPGTATLVAQHDDPADSRVLYLLYQPPGDGEDVGRGFVAQYKANEARTVAASLLRLADLLDGGATKQ